MPSKPDNIKYPTDPLDIKLGQVVLAAHLDAFTGKFKVHPFIVYFRQGLNENTCLINNVYAFRITSAQSGEYDRWKVKINKDEKNNLELDSIVCVDSIFLLNARACKIVGRLSASDFMRVVNARDEYAFRVAQEVRKETKNMINSELRALDIKNYTL